MAGIPVYHGNVLSEHADTYLDLTGIGTLLAMSRWPERNTLAGLYYRPLFGADRVYTLRLDEERDSTDRARMIPPYRIPHLYGERITLACLQEGLDQGYAIRATPLTANFDFAAFRDKWGDRAIPLFALDSKGTLRVFSTREAPQPCPGLRPVISLMPPADAGRSSDAG